MIEAVGIDLVDVGRIERAMRNPRFVDRVLTPNERLRACTPEYVAGRWAAKEALRKCVDQVGWQDVEVLSGSGRAPVLRIVRHVSGLESRTIHVSISHERTHAVAVVVISPGPFS